MTRMGVFGGTFDPVHLGHVALAREVRQIMDLETVQLLPCLIPPHKVREDLTPGADRLAMLALAAQDAPELIPSSLELLRPAPSYTIDSLRQIQASRPHVRLFFLMGMDSFLELRLWKEYDNLLQEFHLVVFGRPGCMELPADADLPEAARKRMVQGNRAADQRDGRIHMVQINPHDLSSTAIRLKARHGESLEGLVAPPVESYLRRCNLYTRP
ncbi:MAG: nicotinate-nucleotide adenylyltransferase [Acidobacteriota bacterium]